MSARSKVRLTTTVLLVVLAANFASAAPRRDNGSDGVLSTISKIVKKIGKILLPLEEPTFPKP